jgi:hypothetical protein
VPLGTTTVLFSIGAVVMGGGAALRFGTVLQAPSSSVAMARTASFLLINFSFNQPLACGLLTVDG